MLAPLAAPSFGPGAVLINEVAWAGTDASPNDEWIELWNPGTEPIDLADWTITDGGDILVSLSGEIAAFGFYLLERTDDTTVSDIPADRIYTGSLTNGGETLGLLDPSGNLIDSANAAGGAWPAGSTSPRASMERHGLLDLPGSWTTFPGAGGNGLDASGSPIRGTPRRPNAPAMPATATATATPTDEPASPFPPGAIIINEVAWAGTIASGNDEWIELHNPGNVPIDLDAWRLTDDGDIDIPLTSTLEGGGYYLLERTDDTTIADLRADRIYTGGLSNSGEALTLLDPAGTVIDVANPGGGPWPAGDVSRHASMERGGTWRTFAGYYGRGVDASGNPIRGTPGGPNSILFPTPMPTWIPGRVVINELLIRPRYDWEGAGGVTTADEFIELYNRGPGAVNLRGWTLDDVAVGGSAPYELPSMTLEPGAFAVFFRSRTRIALNDSGDSVRLDAPDGTLVDKVRYLRIRAANLSFGRLPDGDDALAYGLWPTPGEPNELFAPRSFPPRTILINEVAWAGSPASANHEWIELWNPGSSPVNLFGWTLTDDGDIEVHLHGVIDSDGFLLLERSSDEAVPGISADLIYTGALANQGERLRLLDPRGREVDVANAAAGSWPAGDASTHASMERAGQEWATYAGPSDAGILGSPRSLNAATVDDTAARDGSCPGAGPCP